MKKKLIRKIKEKKKAKILIPEYFEKAGEVFKKNPKLANDYVRKARNLHMKFKLRLPRELKRKFCKHCYSYLKPGVNCRIRTREGKVIYYCLNCKKYMRFPMAERENKPKR